MKIKKDFMKYLEAKLILEKTGIAELFTHDEMTHIFLDYGLCEEKYAIGSKKDRWLDFLQHENSYVVSQVIQNIVKYKNNELSDKDIKAIMSSMQFDKKDDISEDEQIFLSENFSQFTINNKAIETIILNRINEASICIKNGAFLSAVIIIGSTLEGYFYDKIANNPSLDFKKNKKNQDILTLDSFIDVLYDGKLLREDVYKFSNAVRKFRNYIHPRKQMEDNFFPDIHTALICQQVLLASIKNLEKEV